MPFDNSFLDELRNRVPISELIRRRVTWDKRKTNVARGDWWACCPFHSETTPSFHCEDRKGRYHCFGCGASGDHFRFLTELDGLSFPEAVQQVADIAGVEMPAPDPKAAQREKQRASLSEVMDLAARFFQENLQSADGAPARAYLRDRGLSGSVIETFRIGYAANSRNALKAFLASKGVERQQIEACGLVVHGPDIAVSYDRFRDRIMFPILSEREKVIAFGGRAMSADVPAKYLNSNETELFQKGRVLYNFARARRSAPDPGRERTVIAVEGYMDVIALHQAGIENAVAPLGTALTEYQLEMLWRMTPEPFLCFDGDEAGTRAAFRAADLALSGLKPGRSVRFALLPGGTDPDDLVRDEGRAPFDAVVATARPLSDMLWTRETSSGVFDTPEKKAALEAALGRLTQLIRDESVRRHYAQDMRERLRSYFGSGDRGGNPHGGERSGDARRREGRSAHMRAKAGRRYAMSDRLARSTIVRGRSEMPPLRDSVIALTLVNHPELIVSELDEVSAIEFQDGQLDALMVQLMEICAEGDVPDRDSVMQGLHESGYTEVVENLERQVRMARVWTATTDAALEDASEGFRQVLSLYKRTRALRQQKTELEHEIAEATENGDGDGLPQLMQALQSVQNEFRRLEQQAAIVDGFGVLSGRVRGAAAK
ncbi:MAG: DNA primase [Pseudomonadota bacterium]